MVPVKTFQKLMILLTGLGCLTDAAEKDRLVRTTDPLSPEDERKALHVPDGFEVHLFAAEPQINKPINMGFDAQGRLWVSSTVEYPYAAEKSRWEDATGSKVRDSRDVIKILSDTNGDGRADTVVDFADGLNIPTGVLPWHQPEHEAGCIAWSIPNIWYFADTTGDGNCDLREVLYGPMGFEKDTHGMCSSFRLGHDGWVYATHGFNNTSKVKGRDGHEIELTSGNVFRFRPDGLRIEVFTRGQVNPFGLAFDRRGNLYSADCHTAPIYQLLKGATYPHFSRPEPPIGFGPTMIEHTHGSTGICGIVYLDRNVWGPEFNDHILIGNPVNSTVNHDGLRFSGTTPVASEEPDFMTSDDPWFRPVDLQIGPDGALYIADFYNRIIGHYEVPLDHEGRDRERGRIWRVVNQTQVNVPVPPGGKAPVADAIAGLKNDDPFVVRRAVEALQATPEKAALKPLIATLKETPGNDTHLRHVLKLALREHLALPGCFEMLDSPTPEITSISLDIPTEESARFLASLGLVDDPAYLKHIARNGSEETRSQLIESLQKLSKSSLSDVEALMNIIYGLEEGGVDSHHPELVGWALKLAESLLKMRSQQGAGDWTEIAEAGSPSPWTLQKRTCADGREVDVISSLRRGESKAEQRRGMLRSKVFPAPEKISFWICGHRGTPKNPAHDKNFVRLVEASSGDEIVRCYPPRNDVCQEISWDLADREGLQVRLEIVDGDDGGGYAWLGVTRFEPALLSVENFGAAGRYDQALGFLADYLKISAPAALRDQLRPFLPSTHTPPPVTVSKADREKLDALITARLANFDPARAVRDKGESLFKTHCASCHQIHGEGGLIGPQLDGIGARGADRLAQDILDPNRNVDANFYLTSLEMNDGTTATGYLLGERGEILQLVDLTGRTLRIKQSEVVNQKTLTHSLMPPVFGELLSESDFHNLLGWLISAGTQ